MIKQSRDCEVYIQKWRDNLKISSDEIKNILKIFLSKDNFASEP